jgi:hypothetical protein
VFHRNQSRKQSEHKVQEAGERGVTFAWTTHSAITDWTAKVDTKAAIVLSLGSVLLGFFVTLSGKGRILDDMHGWRLILERVGLGWSAIGVVLASLVVAPRLNRRLTRSSWRENFVYFGHLRYWEPTDLREKLRSLEVDQELSVLATQLVATSRIAWHKHRLLQGAMVSLILGTAVVVLSVAWP